MGAIIGALGRLVLRGKQNISLIATIVIGIVAALIGAFIAQALGVGHTGGIDWIKLVIQVVLAAVRSVLEDVLDVLAGLLGVSFGLVGLSLGL